MHGEMQCRKTVSLSAVQLTNETCLIDENAYIAREVVLLTIFVSLDAFEIPSHSLAAVAANNFMSDTYLYSIHLVTYLVVKSHQSNHIQVIIIYKNDFVEIRDVYFLY